MKFSVLRFKRLHLVPGAFIVSGLLVCGGFFWAFFALRHIETPLILHFSSRGIDRIGGAGDLFVMAFFGLLVLAVNFFIAKEAEKRDWFWGKVVAGVTLLFALLLFLAFSVIIDINS